MIFTPLSHKQVLITLRIRTDKKPTTKTAVLHKPGAGLKPVVELYVSVYQLSGIDSWCYLFLIASRCLKDAQCNTLWTEKRHLLASDVFTYIQKGAPQGPAMSPGCFSQAGLGNIRPAPDEREIISLVFILWIVYQCRTYLPLRMISSILHAVYLICSM